MRIAHFAAVTAAVILAAPVQSQNTTDMSAWRQDLRFIAEKLPATHPNAFYRMPRARWDSAITAIDAKLPSMTRNQAMIALSQLVALVNDGHTSINPLFDTVMAVRYYPVRYEKFEDGVFIRQAAPKYASIVGARVVRIGKMSTDEAIAAVATTLGSENEWWSKAWAPPRLSLVEFLDGLGVADDTEHLPIVIERNGKRETVILEPGPRIRPKGHDPMSGIDRAGWVDMITSNDAPLWLRNPQRPYWVTFDQKDSTLFVSYRAVTTLDDEPNAAFWRKVFAMADSVPLKRFVIDVRDNGGGESFFNRQVVRGIVSRPRLDRADKTFVIMSGHTFSAAMNLIEDLEQWTNVTFVGEPSGNALTFFGDHAHLTLPVSGIALNVSTLPWYPANPRDNRQFLAPRFYTPLTSSEYRAGVDPAMRVILANGTQPTLAQTVEAAVVKGDTAEAFRLLTKATNDPLNRFRSPEVEVNALGYRLLPANRAGALAVFKLNVRAFPKSANVWDSLGEALLANGERDAAIAAYKKAVELNPNQGSAVDALHRLGAM